MSEGLVLTGDAATDVPSIRDHLIGNLGGGTYEYGEGTEYYKGTQTYHNPDAFNSVSDFQSEFSVRFQEASRARRLKRRPATGRDRGAQIQQISSKLGEEVYRPDDLSFASYLRMMRDSEIKAAVEVVKNSTMSRGWEINGGDPEMRDWFIEMYKKMPMNQVFPQILSAFEFGSSFTVKKFDDVELPGGKPGIGITKYKVLPPWTIALLMKRSGDIIRLRQYPNIATLGNPNNFDLVRSMEGTYVDRRGGMTPLIPNAPGGSGNALPPYEDFDMGSVNIFTFQPQFGNPFGESALKPAYTDWVFKEHFLTFQGEYMQIMAGGAIIGTAGMAEVDEMRDELVQFSSSGVIALPEDQTVVIDRPSQTESPFMTAIRYHDEQMTKALLVPVLLMGQKTEFGSRSLGETHFELFKIVRIQKMQQDLQRWIQNDIEQLAFWNWGITDHSKLPKFRFKAWSTVDLEQLINMLKKAGEMGLIFMEDIDWLRDIVEFPDAPPEGSRTFFPLVGDMSQTDTVGERPDPDLRRKRGEPASGGSKRDKKDPSNSKNELTLSESQERDILILQIAGVIDWLKASIEDGSVDLTNYAQHSATGKGLEQWGVV